MKEYILKNGMKIIYKKNDSPLTSISISIDAGAGTEEDILGVAHATEHMIYKGTKNRSEQEINRELSNTYGFQNAMTNYPYVIFYGTLLSEDFKKGIELFSDIIINPTFKEEGFKEEMDVIITELNEWDEELEQFCEDKLFYNTFTEERIKYPIIGTLESLKSITLEDIKNFYNKRYFPRNTSIAVVSSLDFNEVKDNINEYFGQWDAKGEDVKEIIYEDVGSIQNTYIKSGISTSKIEIVYRIDHLSNEEIKSLKILNALFGEGINSILFNELRTKNGLIYDIITKISNENYIKLYKITLNTSKENVDKVISMIEECALKVEEYISSLSIEEIGALKKSFKLKKLFKEEQSIVLAKELSTYDTMFGDYKIYTNEVKFLQSIGKTKLLKVARNVFKNPKIQIITYK